MTCEKCQKAGQQSKIFIKGSLNRSLIYHEAYYDEDGVYHDHDPNGYQQGFECSNGHVWVTENPIPCPSELCGFNK